MAIPIIGLSTYNIKNKHGFPIAALMHSYITAITEAGGVAVMVPSGLPEEARNLLITRLDGLLLTGGGDVSIERYKGEPHPSVAQVDPHRDELEIDLLLAAIRTGLPFLGICRGLQIINVALGGSLYTHLQSQFSEAIKHDYDSGLQRRHLAHEVNLEESSRLVEIMGERKLKVNSLHHQGVKELATALRPTAYAPDGLVEAIELPSHVFGMGVQWHPEWLVDQPATRRLFQAFIKASGKREKNGIG